MKSQIIDITYIHQNSPRKKFVMAMCSNHQFSWRKKKLEFDVVIFLLFPRQWRDYWIV